MPVPPRGASSASPGPVTAVAVPPPVSVPAGRAPGRAAQAQHPGDRGQTPDRCAALIVDLAVRRRTIGRAPLTCLRT